MTDSPPDRAPKLDIDWLKTLAGALAAVTTAVLLSTLGAAGTLIGAALGSVAATVGTALYSQGLATSRARVAQVQETALHKVGIAQAEVRRAARRRGAEGGHGADGAVEAHLEYADDQLAGARQDLDAVPSAPQRWGRLVALPWKRVGLLAGGTFALVVIALSAFELIGGQPVSSYTGGSEGDGTSISRLTGSGDRSDDDGRDDRPDPEPSDGASNEPDQSTEPSPSGQPSGQPTDQPSDQPSDQPTGSAPSEESTEVPGETATPTPSSGTTPTAPTPTASTTGPAG